MIKWLSKQNMLLGSWITFGRHSMETREILEYITPQTKFNMQVRQQLVQEP